MLRMSDKTNRPLRESPSSVEGFEIESATDSSTRARPPAALTTAWITARRKDGQRNNLDWGNRDIPFGPTLEQALCNHLGRRGTSDDSLVFPSRNGTYLRPGNLHKRWLLPACAKAELRRFSWHDFRRTHATLLSDMGEPLKTAQAQLGHASLSTTAEIYAQAVPASQRAAVERLERLWAF
jgi:integrase